MLSFEKKNIEKTITTHAYYIITAHKEWFLKKLLIVMNKVCVMNIQFEV